MGEPRPPQIPPTRELAPEERRIAQSLENLHFLESQDIMNLILVWRKFKTATQFLLPLSAPPRDIQELEAKARAAGLFFKDCGVTPKKISGRNPQRIFFVSNNQQDLDLISNVWFGDHTNDPKVYKEMGRMSGFPQTAIDTYTKFTELNEQEKSKKREELTLSRQEQKELFSADIYPFSHFFYMSREHWKSEVETVRKWAEEIKLVSPTLYQLILMHFGR